MRGAGFAAKFALGYSVTVTAGLLSYPLDTIRRRMMMTSGGKDAGKYKNSLDCGRQILASEGMKSMYKVNQHARSTQCSNMQLVCQVRSNDADFALVMSLCVQGAGSNILRGLAGALVLVSFDYCKNFYLEWKYPGSTKGKEVKISFG